MDDAITSDFDILNNHSRRFLEQEQFCLTLKLICCPKPWALGNRPIFKSNNTAVVLKHDFAITMNNIENISAQLYIDEIYIMIRKQKR